jgi:hypothetical protein
MASFASYRIRRFGALGLALFVMWILLQGGVSYVSQRIQLSRDKANAEAEYRLLLQRRVDIPVLQRQLSLLNTSDQIRQSLIEAPSDRAALVRLQQLVRAAVEQSKGKLLSAIESKTDQQEETVALLVRARLPESMTAQFFGQIENGNPRLRIDEVSLVSRSPKPGEVGDVELTATFRARWFTAEKS